MLPTNPLVRWGLGPRWVGLGFLSLATWQLPTFSRQALIERGQGPFSAWVGSIPSLGVGGTRLGADAGFDLGVALPTRLWPLLPEFLPPFGQVGPGYGG